MEVADFVVPMPLVRRNSRDLARFRRCLPTVEKLSQFDPGSIDWRSITGNLDRQALRELMLTMRERDAVLFDFLNELGGWSAVELEECLFLESIHRKRQWDFLANSSAQS